MRSRPQVATARLDVADHVEAKVGALCACRSQFPLEQDMFPDFLLRELTWVRSAADTRDRKVERELGGDEEFAPRRPAR
jgi:hypothetical protein